MDIKELDKRQLILLTLLITFVVSIATGIVTVSLMQQMPKTVPQTINNVIQRTIEKVTTTEPVPTVTTPTTSKTPVIFGDGDVVVMIYPKETKATDTTAPTTTEPTTTDTPKPLGTGIIISDVGLILVDTSVLTESNAYIVALDKNMFDATVLQKFTNGFTMLRIAGKATTPTVPSKTTDTTLPTTPSTQKVDKVQ